MGRSAVNRLKDVGKQAKDLHADLRALAERRKELSAETAERVASLAGELDAAARDAARGRRRKELQALDEVIAAHEASLSVPSLPGWVREEVASDLVEKRARRARLLAQEGTDFGGMLTEDEAHALAELVHKARAEARRRETAAALLGIVVGIADLAGRIAGKLAT